LTSEHPLITNRRALQIAITEQLELARGWRTQGAINQHGRAYCQMMEAQANSEAGRLVNRMVAVQEQIEDFDLD